MPALCSADDIEKKVAVLSGGEKARLTLAKLILSKTNLLILDEPTNHLDIPSREVLENAVAEFDGTVIAVSHDRYFTKRLATRVIEMGDVVRDWRGGYDEYVQKREAREVEQRAQEAAKESQGKEEYQKRKQDASERRREAAQRRKVRSEIEKLEKELEDINEELFGDAATDYIRAGELDSRREAVEERLMELYEEQEGFEE